MPEALERIEAALLCRPEREIAAYEYRPGPGRQRIGPSPVADKPTIVGPAVGSRFATHQVSSFAPSPAPGDNVFPASELADHPPAGGRASLPPPVLRGRVG